MTTDASDSSPRSPSAGVSHAKWTRIVGIGASAGGIEAVSQLLRELPADAALAVLVVLHLDPKHESNLVGLLAKATTLTVETATADARIEARHVYVIPPNANLIIEGDRLRLLPRQDPPTPHLPVDQLFFSMAETLAERSIGVVLSGTGSDGTRGVAAIKHAGGVTYAQDDSAKFDGMPSSAIGTGCVDAVLSPVQIAHELARFPLARTEAPVVDVPHDDDELERLFGSLREKMGVDFSGYKPSTLRRRIGRRLAFHRLERLSDYRKLLEHTPGEVRALHEDLLIHVTGFFRDSGLFDALRSSVFPKLVEARPDDAPIRVWVPGCASGEEVYSIAIGLMEFLTDAGCKHAVKLFGTDVSDGSIARARMGLYPEASFEEVAPAIRARFFVPAAGGYQVRRDLRDMCVFARQDLTSDPPFSNMDLISCRNLLIYMGQGLQHRVLGVLHYALKDSGFLVLGNSESIATYPGFAAVDAKNRIFAKVPGTTRVPLGVPGVAPLAGPVRAPAVLPLANATDVAREADRAILARHGAPGFVVTGDLSVVQFRGQTGAFLDPVPGTASLDLFRMAREEIRLALRGAIDEANESGEPALRSGLWIKAADGLLRTDIEVLPIRVPLADPRLFVVLFRSEAVPIGGPRAEEALPPPAVPNRSAETELRRELVSTREYLRSVIEQLEASNEEMRAANEEAVSSNEELLSTNEELQTAKEELQATNEELTTVNEEVLRRGAEAASVSADLVNVLSSVEIPIVLLGPNSRIRRFTPSAGKLLNLIATDVGRPITDLKPLRDLPNLAAMITDVLRDSSPRRREARDDDGHWREVVVRPHVTLDGRTDGTVVSAADIDAIKTSQQAVAEARDFAQGIVDSVREWLIVLDEEFRVRSANRALLRALVTTPERLIGRLVFEIGGKSWDVPALRELLDEAGRETGAIHDIQIEVDVPSVGKRIVAVHAHRIEHGGERTHTILLALDDVTDKVRADQTRQAYEEQLKRLAFETTVAEERERRRIAADLHDRIGQALALTEIKLAEMRTGGLPLPAQTIDDCLALVRESIAEARSLTFELSPPILYDLGIEAAVSWLADQMKVAHALDVHVEGDREPKPLDDIVAAILFRAIRELLMNVLKHAGTRAARVSLHRERDELLVEVKDGGVGFDLEQAAPTGGFGLFSVREQLSPFGGRMIVESVPGEGAKISIRVPLAVPAEKDNGSENPPRR